MANATDQERHVRNPFFAALGYFSFRLAFPDQIADFARNFPLYARREPDCSGGQRLWRC